QALRVDLHHPEATYNLGLVRWRSGRMTDDELLRQLREASTSLPGHWLPRYLRAQVHVERADCSSALEEWQGIEECTAEASEVAALLTWPEDPRPHSPHCMRTFEGHRDGVLSVCFSGDGKYALSGGEFGSLRLWEVSSGRCLRTFEGHRLQ